MGGFKAVFKSYSQKLQIHSVKHFRADFNRKNFQQSPLLGYAPLPPHWEPLSKTDSLPKIFCSTVLILLPFQTYTIQTFFLLQKKRCFEYC